MHVCRFVDAINEGANVRLDLNDGMSWFTEYEGVDFTPPPLRRTITSSQLADGDLVTSAVYENREIGLPLRIVEQSANGVANQLARLHRELDRPSNLLEVKRAGASRSVFFRTLRSDMPSMREVPSAAAEHFAIQARLLAEPFAIGARVDLNSETISGTLPASAEFVFGSIAGDVETPLLVAMTGSSVSGSVMALGTRRRGTPGAVTFARASSGSASPSATGTQVLTFGWPTAAGSSSSPDFVGDYRVFANGFKSIPGSVLAAWVASGGYAARECLIDTASTNAFWFDLGVVSLPSGSAGVYDGYGQALPALSSSFEVWARLVSGAATAFTVNSLYFVPADQEFAVVKTPSADGRFVFDGPNDALYTTSSGALLATEPFARRGRLPMLSPGAQQTRVVMLNGLQGSVPGGSATGSVTFSYWPRYRFVSSDPAVSSQVAQGGIVTTLPRPTAALVGNFAVGALLGYLPRPTSALVGNFTQGALFGYLPMPTSALVARFPGPPQTLNVNSFRDVYSTGISESEAIRRLSDSSDSSYLNGPNGTAAGGEIGFGNLVGTPDIASFVVIVRYASDGGSSSGGGSLVVTDITPSTSPSVARIDHSAGGFTPQQISLGPFKKLGGGTWTAAQFNGLEFLVVLYHDDIEATSRLLRVTVQATPA